MKIYFDNVLINPDYYTQCSQTGLLFNENDTFKLGSTVCRSFIIGVDKNAVSEIPTNITLEFDNVTYTQFKIDKYEENDVEYIFYLVDRMIDLDFKYDASEIFVGGKTTLKLILEDICSKIGIEARVYDYLIKTEDNDYLTTENSQILKTEGNVNTWWQSKEISWYDDKITAREYLSYIAELNGGYAIINNNNEMEIRSYNNIVKYELNSLNCDSLKVGNQHKITKVVYDFGINKYEAGTDGETVYINQNNKFISSQDDIDEIYDIIKDFEFYTITNNTAMIGKADIGECIRIDNEYLTIVQINNWKYNVNTWIGGYNLNINSSTLEGSIVQETFTEEHIKGLEVDIDRANNQIVLKATEDGHLAQVKLGTNASQGSSFDVLADDINFNGKTFNLTTENMAISSTNFNVDNDGKLTCRNAEMNDIQINSGSIELQNAGDNHYNLLLINGNDTNQYTKISSGRIITTNNNSTYHAQFITAMSTLYLHKPSNFNEGYYYSYNGSGATSDIRYKENIANIKDSVSLKIITSLTPIEFTYKNGDTYYRGLSAQEVEKVLKNNNIENEIYSYNKEEDRYYLNYTELIPDLINCIKNLKERVETLEKQIKEDKK